MATTSGTVGRTQISVNTLIEHAFRRCGKLASTISSELQISARENLFFILSDLANRGISLWCVQKTVLGVIPEQIVFDLPIGTVDSLYALYRTKTDLTGTVVSAAGWQGLNLGVGSEQAVYTASIMFSVDTVNAVLYVESSDDGSAWIERQTFAVQPSVPAGQWQCADLDNSAVAQYWRIRDASGTLPTVDQILFSIEPYEVPMAQLNRDDYASLPNKTFNVPNGSKSLQYWYDKQIRPRVWIWPSSQGDVDQLVFWLHHQIQDVGALTNLLDVPQRWYESIIFLLAARVALELPPGELPQGRYELLSGEAEKHLTQAEDGESDGSAYRLQPAIRGYTR